MIGMFARKKSPSNKKQAIEAKGRGVGQAQRTKNYYPQSMAV
jgi:hypothetical protein